MVGRILWWTAIALLGGVVAQFSDEPGFLEVIQVQPPAVVSIPSSACQTVLMEYIFANSYGQPFKSQYAGPPAACQGPWSHVLLNLSVVSVGVQFDRLATAWLGDVLLWETSTAEPTSKGIHFQYTKDTAIFSTLWAQPQEFIFDLGNIVNNVYTGTLNATITATFIPGTPTEQFADLILPLSSGVGQFWSIPDNNATSTLTIPASNIEHATAQLFASGNGNEEFWYSNTFNDYVDTFTGTSLLGGGPFREVQIVIDGRIAGVAWPFPIVYTGGIVPGLWRPVVGIDAYDVPSYEVSLDPWLGLLADGQSHTFELRVIGMPTPLENWYAAGNIKLWTGKQYGTTTGEIIHYSVNELPHMYTTTHVNQDNSTLSTTLKTSRHITITSRIRQPSSSKSVEISWKQEMSYYNIQLLTDDGNTQTVNQQTWGINSDRNGPLFSYNYPLVLNSTYAVIDSVGSYEITADISRGYDWEATDAKFSPLDVVGKMETDQQGSAYYIANLTTLTSKSGGSTNQDMAFAGDREEDGVVTYERQISAEHGAIVTDSELLNGQKLSPQSRIVKAVASLLVQEPSPQTNDGYAVVPMEQVLGRKWVSQRPIIFHLS